MALAHLTLALQRDNLAVLSLGVALAGLGFGSAWPLMVIIPGELFGLSHLGANYMVYDGAGSSLGAVGFAWLLPRAIYNAHATDDGSCTGARCFCLTHAIIAIMNIVSVAVASLLTIRVRWKLSHHGKDGEEGLLQPRAGV